MTPVSDWFLLAGGMTVLGLGQAPREQVSAYTADLDLLQIMVLPVEIGTCEVIRSSGENQVGGENQHV